MRKYIIVFGFLGVLLLVLFCYQLIFKSDTYFHFVMCDVGQGDGMYIRTPDGSDMVVDGGPDGTILNCLSRHMPFWDRSIDVVFLTHGHSDHVTGLLEVLSNYDVRYFVTQDDLGEGEVLDALQELLLEAEVDRRYVTAGDSIQIDGIAFRVMWPSEKYLEETDDSAPSFDKNTTSLTLYIEYGEFEVLLTGDAEERVVRDVLSRHDVDVLKVAHQGSFTGTGPETFSMSRPQLALISVGENTYGHPHQSVLEVLEAQNIEYWRTDEKGDIEVVSDGERFWVER